MGRVGRTASWPTSPTADLGTAASPDAIHHFRSPAVRHGHVDLGYFNPHNSPENLYMVISCTGMLLLALCFVAALWAAQPDRFRQSRSRLFVLGVTLLCLAVVLAAVFPVVERICFEPHRSAMEQLTTELLTSSSGSQFQSGSSIARSIEYPVIRVETHPDIAAFILRHSGVGPYEREGLDWIRDNDSHATIEECWDLNRFTGDWYHAMWICPGG